MKGARNDTESAKILPKCVSTRVGGQAAITARNDNN